MRSIESSAWKSAAIDYVIKPFSPRELVARVQAIMKRTRGKQSEAVEIHELSAGGVRLDLLGHGSYWKDKKLSLTATEFALLKTFLVAPERVFSRDQLMDLAYANAVTVSDRTIDSHIRNLRGKYAKAGCKELIETLHGVGYKLGSCR